jgi:hypothetical protein
MSGNAVSSGRSDDGVLQEPPRGPALMGHGCWGATLALVIMAVPLVFVAWVILGAYYQVHELPFVSWSVTHDPATVIAATETMTVIDVPAPLRPRSANIRRVRLIGLILERHVVFSRDENGDENYVALFEWSGLSRVRIESALDRIFRDGRALGARMIEREIRRNRAVFYIVRRADPTAKRERISLHGGLVGNDGAFVSVHLEGDTGSLPEPVVLRMINSIR